MRGEERISMSRGNNSWRPFNGPPPTRALMQVWQAAQSSQRHHLLLCHTQDSTRGTQAPLHNTHKPRLRLGRDKLGKHSDRLRQAQTTLGEGQASRKEQSNPAAWRLPRQDIATRLHYIPTDSDVRRDMPAVKHCNSFVFPLVPLPLRL
jgi:hypothetical protein